MKFLLIPILSLNLLFSSFSPPISALPISNIEDTDIDQVYEWLMQYDYEVYQLWKKVVDNGLADFHLRDMIKALWYSDPIVKNYELTKDIINYGTNLLKNGGNKNYYDSPEQTTVVNKNVYNHTTNLFTSIHNYQYTTYEVTNKNYNFNNNSYNFTLTNNQSYTVINNYNNTTIIDSGNNIYQMYYRLPDGTSSYNLTPETALNGYKTSLSVANYSNIVDSNDLVHLYHFDGNFKDSAYKSSVLDVQFDKGSAQYVDDQNFGTAVAYEGGSSLGVFVPVNGSFSFRFYPMVNDDFEFTINGQTIASRHSTIETTYDYVEWVQHNEMNGDMVVTITTDSFRFCEDYNPEWDLVDFAAIGYEDLFDRTIWQIACKIPMPTYTNDQRAYNIVNKKLYEDNNQLVNYGMWNYIYIDSNHNIYLNGIKSGVLESVPTSGIVDIYDITLDTDSFIYLDELAVFNSNKSHNVPSLPYDTNSIYTLPGTYLSKEWHTVTETVFDEVEEEYTYEIEVPYQVEETVTHIVQVPYEEITEIPDLSKGSVGETMNTNYYTWLVDNRSIWDNNDSVIIYDPDENKMYVLNGNIRFESSISRYDCNISYNFSNSSYTPSVSYNDYWREAGTRSVIFNRTGVGKQVDSKVTLNIPQNVIIHTEIKYRDEERTETIINTYYRTETVTDTRVVQVPREVIKEVFDYVTRISDSVINNQILIQSSLPIYNYKFGGVRYSNPSAGDVYVSIDDFYNITSVQQFDGTDWISVKSAIYNEYLNMWISSLGFNIKLNDWKFTEYEYETDSTVINTLITFLRDMFDKLFDLIRNINPFGDNSVITDVDTDVEVPSANDYYQDIKTGFDNLDLESPQFQLDNDTVTNFNLITQSIQPIFSNLFDSPVVLYISIPLAFSLLMLIL